MTDDRDLKPSDVQSLSSREGIAAFLGDLGYRLDARLTQTPQAMGITSESLQGQILHIERLADHENGTLQVYLVELRSVTQANLQGLARALRNRAGQYLLVLTSDYEELDFVLLERVLPGSIEQGLGMRQVGIRPRTLTVNRRNPGPVALRVLRRFTFTEADADAQYDKLLSAYTVADWSEKFFNNRALFSDYYLNDRLRSLPEWSEDPKPAYKRLRELYAGSPAKFVGKDESVLRKELFEPLLAVLGFEARQGKSSTSDEVEPDYRLSAQGGNASDKALAVCLAYIWGRSLDGKDETRDLQTPEENPAFAVVSLLEKAEAPWAIVTNGKIWRLYSAKAHSRSTNYYEIDLEEALASSDPNEFFRYFWLLFRAAAFEVHPEQREGQKQSLSFLDTLLNESEAFAKRLGDRLKDRVFEEIFPHFAEGFIQGSGGTGQLLALAEQHRDAELSNIFQATLTFLYRLLFLLYAESRDLLPVREARGYWEASLSRLKAEVAKAAGPLEDEVRKNLEKAYRNDSAALYNRIFELCKMVDEGDRDLNVPLYNGGLFLTKVAEDDASEEAKHARFLVSHKLPDRFLALGLDLMARDIDEKRGDLVFIDYKSLGVRQLGSIYEGLLEFKLRVATEKMAVVRGKKTEEVVPYAEAKRKELKIVTKGRGKEAEEKTYSKGAVYLENDRRERKATGSYYTPDYIVKYIVENTVGPVLEEKFEALRPKLREAQKLLAKEREKASALRKALGKSDDPEREAYLKSRALVDELFSVKVLDPAMGSGHFLVEAVDFITDRMLRFLYAFPWNPVQYELGETRRKILDAMEDQGVVIDRGRLTDVNLLKRHVLKRCIYGVDLNPMAVELAKVSLWLDCFTLGAPLSFLDHHLKPGNSLVGATIEEAKKAIEGTTQLDLFGSRFAGLMSATELMRHIGELSDVTAKQVEESRREYRKASDALAPFKRMLDVYTSQWFGNERALDLFRRGHADEWFQKPGSAGALSSEDRILVETAIEATAKRVFFHWELEFPEIFFGPRLGTTRIIERLEHAGFDAVVGNPPYVGFHGFHDLKSFLSKRFVTCRGKFDIYVAFWEQSLAVACQRGFVSFVNPSAFMKRDHGRSLRELLASMTIERLHDFLHECVFEGAINYVCIPVVRKGAPSPSHSSIVTYGSTFVSKECLFPQKSLTGETWVIGSGGPEKETLSIDTKALLSDITLAVAEGIVTGKNDVFLVNAFSSSGRAMQSEGYAKPALRGECVDRYAYHWDGTLVIYPYEDVEGRTVPIAESVLRKKAPVTYEYLCSRKRDLAGRSWFESSSKEWFELWNQRSLGHQAGPKLVIQENSVRCEWNSDDGTFFYLDTCCGLTLPAGSELSYGYLLGVLNSSLLDSLFRQLTVPKAQGHFIHKPMFLKQIPIRTICFATPFQHKAKSVDTLFRISGKAELELFHHQVKQILSERKSDPPDRSSSREDGSDIIHDLITMFSQVMVELNRELLEQTRSFVQFAFDLVKPTLKLGRYQIEKLRENAVVSLSKAEARRAGEHPPLSKLFKIFESAQPRAGSRALPEKEIQLAYDRYISSISPIKDQICRTDGLIDVTVAALYGLNSPIKPSCRPTEDLCDVGD